MPGKLVVIATPIGNLRDLTFRALEAFQTVDEIYCEDTRVTSKILATHDIRKPLHALHEHSTPEKLAFVMDEISAGKIIGYASDAGTPGVNDPGGKLVQLAYQRGVQVEPIPGVSALTTAISVCGFAMDEFWYRGFVPLKKHRQRFFDEVAACESPVIFFESTHRIEKTLSSLGSTLEANRQLFVGREMTKMHETYYRGTVAEVLTHLRATDLRGEFTCVVGPKISL